MKPDALLAGLEQAAASLSVKVSYETLRASVGIGGLCRVKGQYRVIIDKKAGVNERIATLASALSRFDLAAAGQDIRDVVAYYGLRQAS